MIEDKHRFLRSLFSNLETRGVGFCISRNAEETFADTGSDLDLMVAREDWGVAEAVCREVAEATGFHLVMKARFTNLCLLFWHPDVCFVRVDIEPGLRWRVFPVADARAVLGDVRRHGGLRTPSARGEALVLVAKAAWMGGLSERYKKRLEQLEEETGGFPPLNRKDDAAKLVRLARTNPGALKRHLVKRMLRRPSLWPPFFHALADDAVRLMQRALHPPGIHVFSSGCHDLDRRRLSELLKLAFPPGKSLRFRTGEGSAIRTFLALFRGGMVWEEADESGGEHPGRTGFGFLARSANRFQIRRQADGVIRLHHGFSSTTEDIPDDPAENERRIVRFIGAALAGNPIRDRKIEPRVDAEKHGFPFK